MASTVEAAELNRWHVVRLLRVRNHRMLDQGARGARLLKVWPSVVELKGAVNLT